MWPIALALLAARAEAGPPVEVGECKWVRGRYAVYNGSGVRRIWVIGTRRIVALYDYDGDVPPEIDHYTEDFIRYRGFEDALYGDFYVCARQRSRPGRMQHVRIVKTRKLLFHGKAYPPSASSSSQAPP